MISKEENQLQEMIKNFFKNNDEDINSFRSEGNFLLLACSEEFKDKIGEVVDDYSITTDNSQLNKYVKTLGSIYIMYLGTPILILIGNGNISEEPILYKGTRV